MHAHVHTCMHPRALAHTHPPTQIHIRLHLHQWQNQALYFCAAQPQESLGKHSARHYIPTLGRGTSASVPTRMCHIHHAESNSQHCGLLRSYFHPQWRILVRVFPCAATGHSLLWWKRYASLSVYVCMTLWRILVCMFLCNVYIYIYIYAICIYIYIYIYIYATYMHVYNTRSPPKHTSTYSRASIPVRASHAGRHTYLTHVQVYTHTNTQHTYTQVALRGKTSWCGSK